MNLSSVSAQICSVFPPVYLHYFSIHLYTFFNKRCVRLGQLCTGPRTLAVSHAGERLFFTSTERILLRVLRHYSTMDGDSSSCTEGERTTSTEASSPVDRVPYFEPSCLKIIN
jgi:hypothetical protein